MPRQLTAENETRFREYVRMLEVLSTNRSLEHIIEEEEKMLSQVDQTRLPSFRIGMQQSMEQGIQQGLERLLIKRFGALGGRNAVAAAKCHLGAASLLGRSYSGCSANIVGRV